MQFTKQLNYYAVTTNVEFRHFGHISVCRHEPNRYISTNILRTIFSLFFRQRFFHTFARTWISLNYPTIDVIGMRTIGAFIFNVYFLIALTTSEVYKISFTDSDNFYVRFTGNTIQLFSIIHTFRHDRIGRIEWMSLFYHSVHTANRYTQIELRHAAAMMMTMHTKKIYIKPLDFSHSVWVCGCSNHLNEKFIARHLFANAITA